jgi:hypothetical protein
MFSRLLVGTGLCVFTAQGQFMEIAEAMFEAAEDIADAAIENQDKAQMGHKLDNIQSELDAVSHRLDEIDAKLGSIQDEVKQLGVDLTHELKLQALQDPLSEIQSTADKFNTYVEPDLRLALAQNIVVSDSAFGKARDKWLSYLQGTCTDCNGKTIIAQQFEYTGSIPQHVAQSLIRTMATAHYLTVWAFERQGDLATRNSYLNSHNDTFNAMWEKNMQQAFYMTDGCQWDASLQLHCSLTSRQAANTLRYQNGTVVLTDSHDQSLPTRGGDKPFSLVQCSTDGSDWPIAMHGDTHIPHDHKIAYVAGFYLKCKDKTGDDGRWTDYHQTDGNSVVFDINLGSKPMRRMDGCVNHMKGHDHTFWGSGVKVYSVAAPSDPDSCVAPVCYQISHGPDACTSADDPIHYTMDCGRGYAMQGFSGSLYTPKGHDIPYIAAMTVRCDPYVDPQRTVPEGSTILV